MDHSDEAWDEIDWDSKITKESQSENNPQTPKNFNVKFTYEQEDENYYEINQSKKQEKTLNKNVKSRKYHDSKEELPFSHKDLCLIRSYQFNKLIYETFGNLNKFIVTHEQEKISDESLVELIKIDVALLEVPFIYHNQLLLENLSKISSFWMQIIELIKRFFEINYKNPKYLLLIDMKGLFESVESLIFWLIAHKCMNNEMEEIFLLLLKIVNQHVESTYINAKKFHQVLQSMEGLSSELNLFEIFPSINELKCAPSNMDKNLIHGDYDNVLQYLKVQLPLLKEDFMCKLRNGFDSLKNMESIDRTIRTHDATIFPNVQIKLEWHKLWHNINCPIILVNLYSNVKFFNGQMLCFTSTRHLDDLIVVTVLKCSNIESLDQNAVVIEIKKTENIKDIFDRDLFMIEPKSFFDPYHQVFASLKSLNEYNFPFKNRILKIDKVHRFPSYERPNYYDYNGHSLSVNSFDDWSKVKLGLESTQVNAVYNGICNDFLVIVGPPGSGKTFIGLQILEILLNNTSERILILTQTNNALDKFLIGALKFTNDIVRLGGQCKNEILEPFIAKLSNPYESRSYLKKIQAMQRDSVTKLIDSNESNESIFHQISLHYRLSDEINQLNSYCNINDKRIFGMTTSYAAHNSSINKMLQPGIVLIEEASEILESHILASLTKETKHVIMIGDHMQLRPQTNSFDLQRNYDFNVSLFERLIMNKFNFISLDVQMRMRPQFCDLVRETIYKDLKDGLNVKNYPNVKGLSSNFFCLNHNFPEQASETSKENSFEVDFILNLYKRLLNSGNLSNEIVILTPYTAQWKRFKQKLMECSLPRVRVAILDAYQGEESNIILLSLVRSNKNNDIGFLSMENRISVILSRAKIGFYICGNVDCFANASRIWRKIKNILVRHRAIGNSLPSDFGF